MKLKIDNIGQLLKTEGEVLVTKDSFESDMSSLMDYYKRNSDTESGLLSKLSLEDDMIGFANVYLSKVIFGNETGIVVSRVGDKIKISIL